MHIFPQEDLRSAQPVTMTHSHAGEDHTHVHTDECPEELSAKYRDYIESHLESLRTKCDQINACLNELLEGVNPIDVLNGYDLSLNKTCSLVYKGPSETFSNSSGKCMPQEKEDIRSDIEQHLTTKLKGTNADWKPVKTCLNKKFNGTERSSYVDEVCGLAYNKTRICSSVDAHSTVQIFFNDQIHHLRCTCRTLKHIDDGDGSWPLVAKIGAAAGGVSLLLVIIVLAACFMYYKWRKRQTRQKKSPNVIYLPAPNVDNSPVYMEILDNRGYEIAANPPNLPMRYAKHPQKPSNITQPPDQENDPTYLEPVLASSQMRPTLSIQSKDNPGYGAPPEYRETDSPLEPDKPDQSRDVPLGPVPAKRTKKDDRQTESFYFVLEQNENSNKENT